MTKKDAKLLHLKPSLAFEFQDAKLIKNKVSGTGQKPVSNFLPYYLFISIINTQITNVEIPEYTCFLEKNLFQQNIFEDFDLRILLTKMNKIPIHFITMQMYSQ